MRTVVLSIFLLQFLTTLTLCLNNKLLFDHNIHSEPDPVQADLGPELNEMRSMQFLALLSILKKLQTIDFSDFLEDLCLYSGLLLVNLGFYV